ncbi:MAG: hypothetical protein AAGI44_20065 [Pseudomonadota bacterium]
MSDNLSFDGVRELFGKETTDEEIREEVVKSIFEILYPNQVPWKAVILPDLEKYGIEKDHVQYARNTSNIRGKKASRIYYVELIFWLYICSEDRPECQSELERIAQAIWGCSFSERVAQVADRTKGEPPKPAPPFGKRSPPTPRLLEARHGRLLLAALCLAGALAAAWLVLRPSQSVQATLTVQAWLVTQSGDFVGVPVSAGYRFMPGQRFGLTMRMLHGERALRVGVIDLAGTAADDSVRLQLLVPPSEIVQLPTPSGESRFTMPPAGDLPGDTAMRLGVIVGTNAVWPGRGVARATLPGLRKPVSEIRLGQPLDVDIGAQEQLLFRLSLPIESLRP